MNNFSFLKMSPKMNLKVIIWFHFTSHFYGRAHNAKALLKCTPLEIVRNLFRMICVVWYWVSNCTIINCCGVIMRTEINSGLGGRSAVRSLGLGNPGTSGNIWKIFQKINRGNIMVGKGCSEFPRGRSIGEGSQRAKKKF